VQIIGAMIGVQQNRRCKMLNKKLYPVVLSLIIIGAFMLGMAVESVRATSNPPARAVRGELPESNSLPIPVTGNLMPREPKEAIRGGLAEAYVKPAPVASISTGRSAPHSDERLEQALSKFESPAPAGSVSEYPMVVRGGLAGGARPAVPAPIAPKPNYAPHSDEWNDVILDRYGSFDMFYGGNWDRPAKMRGGPIDW
jgi:hypothetical protein